MFGVTRNELLLAFAFGVIGFAVTTREAIMAMNSTDPIIGLLGYYAILYSTLFLLAHFGLVIYKFNIKSPTQTLGLLLITFSFFIIFDWTSCYINTVVHGSCTGISPVYFSSEDGATYYFWDTVMRINNPEISRLLTYSLTPFLLVMIGSTMVSQKIRLKG